MPAIRHIMSRRRATGEPGPSRLRRRSNILTLMNTVPQDLTSPNGSIHEPGRTIWTYPTPPTHLSFGGGPTVATSRLIPLFWGSYWQTATNPSVNDIHQAIAAIIGSPYLSEVTQYGFQSLALDPAVIVITPGPPAGTFSSGDVNDMIWSLIDDGRFPEPDEGGRNIYFAFAPPGTNYDDPTADGAAHDDAWDYDFPLDVDHAWAGFTAYGTLDKITEHFSHELVEILTDPEPRSGWTVDGMPDSAPEIADACYLQVGMVEGYRVAAYYSQRLSACVVPAFPPRYALAVSVRDEAIGPARPQRKDSTETTNHTICFSGTYDWTLVGQQRRVTVIADATGYQQPVYSWSVEGTPVFNSSVAGSPTLPVSAPSDAALDPLALITPVTPAPVTILVGASGNTLVMESVMGSLPADFVVICQVTEQGLPAGYGSLRQDQRAVTVSGAIRVMDDRFAQDLAACLHRQSVLARQLIAEVILPSIDLGDPPPPWVERALSEIEGEINRMAHEARYLAHFVAGHDASLAATLRQLAAASQAVTRATRILADH